jgi:O-antigen/teichoic acid export membrane protein
MQFELNRFFRHTAVYTIGNLAYRGASFILVPLYTRLLTPADYGVIELITVTTFLVQTVLSSGIAHATLRFYFEYTEPRQKNATVSTSLILTFVVNIAVAALLAWFSAGLSQLIFGTAEYTTALRLVWFTMAFEISREINLSFARAREQSTLFSIVAVVQLVVQVAANVTTVWYLRLGVIGIFIGNLTAVVSIWLILTANTVRQCGWRVEVRRMWPVFRYGYPLMFSGVFSSVVQNVDRYLLRHYTSLAALGLYGLALKIASVPGILLVQPFNTSYGPFRFSIMKQDNAKEVYARVLTYYVFVCTFAVLGLSVLSRELVMLAAGTEFWPSYRLVPILLLPGVFGGVGYCLQTGIYIEKKTQHMFYAVALAGAAYIATLRGLVPWWGVYGAAFASIASAVVNLGYTYVVSQRLYHVRYEHFRVVKILAGAIAVGVPASFIAMPSLVLTLALKSLAVLCFPFVLAMVRLYTAEERSTVERAVAALKERVWQTSGVSGV